LLIGINETNRPLTGLKALKKQAEQAKSYFFTSTAIFYKRKVITASNRNWFVNSGSLFY